MFRWLKSMFIWLLSSDTRKASGLGLRDLGPPKEKLLNTTVEYPIHGLCLRSVRLGETKKGKIVYWCPHCKLIVEEKDRADRRLRRQGHLPPQD